MNAKHGTTGLGTRIPLAISGHVVKRYGTLSRIIGIDLKISSGLGSDMNIQIFQLDLDQYLNSDMEIN